MIIKLLVIPFFLRMWKLEDRGGEYYQYALIQPSTGTDRFDLVKYKSRDDTIGDALPIIKNELNKPAQKRGITYRGF